MLKQIIIALTISLAACIPTSSQAQQLIGSYVALLSEADHFNSNGQRLTSAAAIIRQDRANYHRYGIRDPRMKTIHFLQTRATEPLLSGCSNMDEQIQVLLRVS